MQKKSRYENRKALSRRANEKSFLERFRRWEGLIVLVAVLCDLNSWGHQFVMDDKTIILENPSIQSPERILEIFTLPYFHPPGLPGDLFRPFSALTFALNYWIGGPHPNSFHAVNRALHVFASLGILWTLRLLIPSPPRLAVLTALLFAAHPIQTEAITYINGRPDALAMCLGLLAWLFFVRLRLSESSRTKPYALSLLFFSLALFSKESGITWMGILVLTELVFFCEGSLDRFFKQFRRNFLPIYLGYFMVTFLSLLARFSVLGGILRMEVRFVENPLAHTPFLPRVLTALKVLFQSLSLLVWPAHFSPDYSYNQVPTLNLWNSPAGLITLALSCVFVGLWVWSFFRAKIVFFGLGFFAISYSLVSNLLFPIGTIRADRLLYMPSLGIFLLMAWMFSRFYATIRSRSTQMAFRAVVALLLLLLCMRTMVRNRDWQDEFVLYSRAVQDAPNNVKSQNFLGWQYYQKGLYDQAFERFQVAQAVYPEFPDVYINLGSLTLHQGKTKEAISYLRRAIELGAHQSGTLNNLGVALRIQGDLIGALAQYETVIQRYPTDASAHFNKAEVLNALGKNSEAIQEFQRTLDLDPHFPGARENLQAILERTSSDVSKPAKKN